MHIDDENINNVVQNINDGVNINGNKQHILIKIYIFECLLKTKKYENLKIQRDEKYVYFENEF